jgi:hypothetical protein
MSAIYGKSEIRKSGLFFSERLDSEAWGMREIRSDLPAGQEGKGGLG